MNRALAAGRRCGNPIRLRVLPGRVAVISTVKPLARKRAPTEVIPVFGRDAPPVGARLRAMGLCLRISAFAAGPTRGNPDSRACSVGAWAAAVSTVKPLARERAPTVGTPCFRLRRALCRSALAREGARPETAALVAGSRYAALDAMQRPVTAYDQRPCAPVATASASTSTAPRRCPTRRSPRRRGASARRGGGSGRRVRR